ncbi:MAG: hypothetical protein GF383_16070 [Candidatus Lokiarchaeota archaeon]|nr:hypothetical protein [Candidatus Lokiarchaeota archaeon]
MKRKYYSKNGLIILGGLLGIFSVFLYYISPLLGSWWYLSWEIFRGKYDIYINAFGCNNEEKQILDKKAFYVGVLVLIGSVLAIIGGMRRLLSLSFVSSLIILIGIFLFLNIIYHSNELNNLCREYDLQKIRGSKIFFGEREEFSWGLGIGFFIALTAGFLILIVSIVNIVKNLFKKHRETLYEKIKMIYHQSEESKKSNLQRLESGKLEINKVVGS